MRRRFVKASSHSTSTSFPKAARPWQKPVRRLLRDIAKETQYGVYLRLQGAKTIETLYQQGLSKLPKSEHQEKLVRQYRERYHWPLALACILLAIEMLFPERKREPESKTLAQP